MSRTSQASATGTSRSYMCTQRCQCSSGSKARWDRRRGSAAGARRRKPPCGSHPDGPCVAAAIARIVVPVRRRLRQMDGHRHEWNAYAPDDLDRSAQGVELRLATGLAAQEADWFGRGDAVDVQPRLPRLGLSACATPLGAGNPVRRTQAGFRRCGCRCRPRRSARRSAGSRRRGRAGVRGLSSVKLRHWGCVSGLYRAFKVLKNVLTDNLPLTPGDGPQSGPVDRQTSRLGPSRSPCSTYCRASNTMAGLAPRFWKLKRRDPRCSFSRILASTKDRVTTPAAKSRVDQ